MPPLTVGQGLEACTFSSRSKGGLQEAFKPPSDLCYQWSILIKWLDGVGRWFEKNFGVINVVS